MKKRYRDHQIVLDIEDTAVKAINSELRKKRKTFYLRNGFHETGRYTVLGEDKFEVICSEKTLDAEGFQSLIRQIHLNTPAFDENLL